MILQGVCTQAIIEDLTVTPPFQHSRESRNNPERTTPYLALGADEATHVLHHTYDGQLHLVAEADLLPDILEGHLLAKFSEQLSHSHMCSLGDDLDTMGTPPDSGEHDHGGGAHSPEGW